jgi:acyl-CoA synthetase (AMP-forming)/AMP-acid ligase II
MVVTQGKNLFPEEVESVLLSLPDVAHASVLGLPDPIRGQQVVAIVQAKAHALPSAQTLAEQCREHLESYKIPKRFFICTDWPMTASGKTDHTAVASKLTTYLQSNGEGTSCMQPLL